MSLKFHLEIFRVGEIVGKQKLFTELFFGIYFILFTNIVFSSFDFNQHDFINILPARALVVVYVCFIFPLLRRISLLRRIHHNPFTPSKGISVDQWKFQKVFFVTNSLHHSFWHTFLLERSTVLPHEILLNLIHGDIHFHQIEQTIKKQ